MRACGVGAWAGAGACALRRFACAHHPTQPTPRLPPPCPPPCSQGHAAARALDCAGHVRVWGGGGGADVGGARVSLAGCGVRLSPRQRSHGSATAVAVGGGGGMARCAALRSSAGATCSRTGGVLQLFLALPARPCAVRRARTLPPPLPDGVQRGGAVQPGRRRGGVRWRRQPARGHADGLFILGREHAGGVQRPLSRL